MSFDQMVFDETEWNCGNQKVINLPMMIDAATLSNRNKKKNFWKIEFFLSKLTFRHFIFILKVNKTVVVMGNNVFWSKDTWSSGILTDRYLANKHLTNVMFGTRIIKRITAVIYGFP
jgi:hypothetical protein